MAQNPEKTRNSTYQENNPGKQEHMEGKNYQDNEWTKNPRRYLSRYETYPKKRTGDQNSRAYKKDSRKWSPSEVQGERMGTNVVDLGRALVLPFLVIDWAHARAWD